MKGDIFEIKRIKPETIVTLPMERITSFSAMEEPNFMIKYQGDKARTSKFASGKKYYLVVNYTTQDGSDAMLAFWGTSFEWGYFIDLQNRNTSTEAEPTSYSL